MSLRYALNYNFLEVVGGHIGYGIRPGARGDGLDKVTLNAMLEVARTRELERVLFTCDDSNSASVKTIEACAGRLERVCQVEEIAARFGSAQPIRRYWISL